MVERKRIKNALISVFDKTGLAAIVNQLNSQNVTIYSTGGTQSFIEELGIPVERVEDLTSYPSILGGRVKTLHPKILEEFYRVEITHKTKRKLPNTKFQISTS